MGEEVPLKTIVLEASGVNSAVEEACAKLGCQPSDARVLVLVEGKKGFLGITLRPWKVRVSCGEISEEEKLDSEAVANREAAKAAEEAESNSDEVSGSKDEVSGTEVDSSENKDSSEGEGETSPEDEKVLQNVDKILDDIQSVEVKLDGIPEVKKTKEGIYLIIYQPRGGGKPADLEDIQKKLDRDEIVNVDYEAVREALENNDEQPVRIADYDPEIYVDGDCAVTVEADGMTASLTLIAPKGGNPVSMEEIDKKINAKSIVVEYDKDLITKKIDEKFWDQPFEIARGEDPIPGEDARIVYKFDMEDHAKAQEHEDGSVDFKELNLIHNVLKGEAIGEKIPPTEGTPGKDVYGKPMPAPQGKDELIKIGKNVELSEDGLKLVSAIDGQLKFEGDKPTIEPVFVVQGDLDLHTGNIDFIGSVIINGAVQDGFSIKAQGDVEVANAVGASHIEATGNIIVKGGVAGKGKAELSSEGDIIAKFIESATVRARGHIKLEKALMHSNVRCANLELTGDKSTIVGGNITAADEVVSKTIGSPVATKTCITVGVDEGLLKQLNDVEEALKSNQQSLSKLSKAMELLLTLKSRTGSLPEEKEATLVKTKAMHSQLDVKVKEMESHMNELEAKVNEARGGRVRASDRIYPGVVITIRKAVHHVKDEIRYATLTYENGFIKINPF